MVVVLHEGHGHADTAATSGISVELMVLIAVGILVFVIVSSYALKRYTGV